MEFWGLEVKPGTTVKCEPGDDYVLHLSQAALGESKKPNENALMYVKFDDQKLALGTLSHDKYPHVQFDLVFEKEFELSHTSKGASVFFSGYKVLQPSEEDEMDSDSEEEDDEEEERLNIPVIKENGKAEAKEQKGQGKAAAAASQSNAVPKGVQKKQDDDDDDDSDDSETDDSDEDDGSSADEIGDDESSDEGDSDEDDDSDEEEETPKKVQGMKRAAEGDLKAVSDKKAKVVTPSVQKSGGKKGAAHVSTPHPAKQVSKTPANNDKSKEKSPRSGGSVPCKSCSKTFNSEMALQAHSKAKHAGPSK